MIRVIDDFLFTADFNDIQNNLVYDPLFPWHFSIETEYSAEWNENSPFQFFHGLYRNCVPVSDHFKFLNPILAKLNPRAIIRAKINLTTRSENIIEGAFHIDQSFDHKVAIIYLNTNNGYTLFEDGTKIESVANRVVLFDGNLKHLGTNCTDKQRRVVLNINYL